METTMASAKVNPGICGLGSTLQVAVGADGMCEVSGESDCPHVQKLLAELVGLDPYGEIMYSDTSPRILAEARNCLPHPACPVPSALLKAVEVAAGLALPADVAISVSE
jgi:hypothetical protein